MSRETRVQRLSKTREGRVTLLSELAAIGLKFAKNKSNSPDARVKFAKLAETSIDKISGECRVGKQEEQVETLVARLAELESQMKGQDGITRASSAVALPMRPSEATH